MGHKVHPTGIRLGIAKDWNSKWFANKREYAEYLGADLKVRELLKKKLAQAGISKIQIERPAKTARVTIHTARPGVVIGKKGEDIEKLRKEVSTVMGVPAHINVIEVRKPELDAQLVAESIAQQLERRIMFQAPEGITITVPVQTEILVAGADKQRVGEVAAKIRAFRPPEPYKGKGVRYSGEKITLKEAKKA